MARKTSRSNGLRMKSSAPASSGGSLTDVPLSRQIDAPGCRARMIGTSSRPSRLPDVQVEQHEVDLLLA